MIPTGRELKTSLSMNGGAQIGAGDGTIGLWCKKQPGGGAVSYAQIMMVRLDGFF